MSTIVIDIPPTTYAHLVKKASESGKSPEALMFELVEATYGATTDVQDVPPNGIALGQPKTARQILQAAGLVVPLSETLKSMIIPGVTLDEVQDILSNADGPSLTEILDQQRGSKR
jgi:hypothetical protein